MMIKVTDDNGVGATDDRSSPTRGIYTVLTTYKTKCLPAPTYLSDSSNALLLGSSNTL